MKQSVSQSDFIGTFGSLRPDNFSYSGLLVLWDYLSQLEEDLGEELEFDVISICCDYCEDDYETIKDYYDIPLNFSHEDYPDEEDYREALKECVIEYLENHTIFVGDIDGECCIYAQF